MAIMSCVRHFILCTILLQAFGNICENEIAEYIKMSEKAAKEIIQDIRSFALPSSHVLNSTNITTASTYAILLESLSLNITATDEGLKNFSRALDVISSAYFKACYGPADQRPKVSEAPEMLKQMLTYLENGTNMTTVRQNYGRLSCLQNFTTNHAADKREVRTDCAKVLNIRELYQCLDSENLACIFNFKNCESQGNVPFRKNCLAFVIDTTGSMGEEIVAARQVIQNFISSEENTLTLCYILVPFNDYGQVSPEDNLDYSRVYDAGYHSNNPKSRPSFSVRNAKKELVQVRGVNDLITDTSNLQASGGGDCPEYGMVGILKALELLDGIQNPRVRKQGKHNVVVLTDASAKDNDDYQSVINKAKEIGVTVHFFYSGNGCDDGFGNYDSIKQATGGVSVDQIDAAHFQQFADFIRSSSFKKRKRDVPSSCQSFNISHFVTKFSGLFETAQNVITITKPNGHSENVATFSNSFYIYTVDNPQPGLWKGCVSSGTLTLTLTTAIDLEFNIEYLHLTESGMLQPTSRLPFACELHNFTASIPKLSLISLEQPLYLNLIENNGNVLQSAALTECSGILTGLMTAPFVPVQYQLNGVDVGGTKFSHVIPNSYVTFNTLSPSLEISSFGSQTVVRVSVDKGSKSHVHLLIHNTQNRPKRLPLTIEASTLPGIQVTYDNGKQFTLISKEFHVILLTFTVVEKLTFNENDKFNWSLTITDNCTKLPLQMNYEGVFKPSACSPPVDFGSCKGTYPRWFFNTTSGQCEQFIYGGCEGNENRFGTLQECTDKCGCPVNTILTSKCSQNPCSLSSCTAYTEAVCEIDKCSKLGNQCMSRYFIDSKEVTHSCDVCGVPADSGYCNQSLTRWFYDANLKRCQQFEYTGCGGNQNNFNSLQRCLETCALKCNVGKKLPCIDDPCKRKSCSRFKDAVCITKSCEECTAHFYNSSGHEVTSLCNLNQICPPNKPKAECISDPCDHQSCPMYPRAKCILDDCGGCNAKFIINETKDVTNECGKKCPSEGQVFSSCGASCVKTCKNVIRNEPLPCSFVCTPGCVCPAGQVLDESNNRCIFPENCACPDCKPVTNCTNIYTPSNGSCNCPVCADCSVDGQSYYESAHICHRTCSNPHLLCAPSEESLHGCACPTGMIIDEKNNRCVNPKDCPEPDPCTLPPKTGPCRGRIQRYFYNGSSESCEMFIYGGCFSNKNNFFSKHDCEKECSDCPPTCSPLFCSANRGSICTTSSNTTTCSGCVVTSCWACYYSYNDLPYPKLAESCQSDCSVTDTTCIKNWGLCVRKAYFEIYTKIVSRDRNAKNFRCWNYPCDE